MTASFSSAISRKNPATCLRSASPRPRNAGSVKRVCWLRGLSIGRRVRLHANALEEVLRSADGTIERIGVARAIGDDAVEEALAIAPYAGVEVAERPVVLPRLLSVAEIERPRDHVRQTHRERKQPGHQMDAEEPQGERHAAVASGVAAVDEADQRRGRGERRLIVRLVASEGSHEDDVRIGLEREAK